MIMTKYDQNNEGVSIFANIVDKLREKSEAELKILYLRFFKSDLKNEWKDIVKDSAFKKVTEKDIIKAIQNNRYKS